MLEKFHFVIWKKNQFRNSLEIDKKTSNFHNTSVRDDFKSNLNKDFYLFLLLLDLIYSKINILLSFLFCLHARETVECDTSSE